MEHKRGDHVFNNGVEKTLRDLSTQVEQVLVVDRSVAGIHGAKGRSDRLQMTLKLLREGLRQPAFQLTVAKSGRVPGGDDNSRRNGEASRRLVQAFQQFLLALKAWEIGKGKDERGGMLAVLRTACLNLRLAVGTWTDSAIDPEAKAVCERDVSGSRLLIKSGEDYLEKVRADLVAMIGYYTP